MKKLFLFSTIAISIFALGACSNSVNKGSFKTLSYGKELSSGEAETRKENILKQIGNYSSFQASYYIKSKSKNNYSESYSLTHGVVASTTQVSYKTDTTHKSKKEGVSISYKDSSEYFYEVSDTQGIIKETVVTSEATTVNDINDPTGHGVRYYAVKPIWNRGAFDPMFSQYSTSHTYEHGRETHIVISDIEESHSFITNGNDTFEQKSIIRTQKVIIADDYLHPLKATQYYDVRRNYDAETGTRYKSLEEVERIYFEIQFKPVD